MKRCVVNCVIIGLLIVMPVLPGFAGWALLDQAQEIPAPNPVAGAFGTAVLELNESGTELTYQITVTGLSGAINAAHFHGPALPGVSAGVVRAIQFNGNYAEGVWRSTDATQPLTPALSQALKDGLLYINLHTTLNGPGEIRGQVNIDDSFIAILDQAQEVPAPNPVAGAIGTAYAVLNDAETEVHYSITVSGLSGPASAAHFHGPASEGVSAGVVKGIDLAGKTHTSGVWSVNDANQPLTPALVQALKNGQLYFNVHTALNGPGEIRGQLNPSQTTSSLKNWVELK